MRVLITGLPRTGTTSLVRLLNKSADVVITNEFGQFAMDKRDNHKKFALRLQTLSKNRGQAFDVDFGGKGRSFDEEYRRISGQHFGGDAYLSWLESQYSVVGDKHTEYVVQMPQILNLEPSIKVILTIRDGRATVASSVRNWRRLRPRPHWVRPSIREAEKLWLENMRHLFAAMELRADTLLVRYEDACRQPHHLLAKLSSFLQHPLNIDRPQETYHPVNVDTWKVECNGFAWCQETKDILKYLKYEQ